MTVIVRKDMRHHLKVFYKNIIITLNFRIIIEIIEDDATSDSNGDTTFYIENEAVGGGTEK